MSNTLKKMEKELRAFAKRNKDVKYTKGLLLGFLLMGALAFTDTLTSPQVKSTENAINQTKRDLNTSISDMHKTFKQAKRQNNKLLRNANLELIQLMEQGDQVVKIPWNTWQWGTVYTYNDWRGEYKGKGDKKEKYPFNGMLVRDANELNRYMLKSDENYASLPQGVNPYSASSNLRTGIITNYGLTNTGPVNEEPRELALSAGIRIKEVNKNSPASTPSAPTIVLPAFEPRLITPPISPARPDAISITPPAINVVVASSGNGESFVADGQGSNSTIQSVAILGGNFKITRDSTSNWTYEYSNYSGKTFYSASAFSTNPAHPGTHSTWSNWSRTGGIRTGALGFQSTIGNFAFDSDGSTMLSNAEFLYTREVEGDSVLLGELAHLDVHGGKNVAGQRAAFDTVTNGLSNKTDIMGAFDDVVSINRTGTQGGTSDATMHTWINSGKLIIEGGNTSITNTYTHYSNPDGNQIK